MGEQRSVNRRQPSRPSNDFQPIARLSEDRQPGCKRPIIAGG